MATLRLVIPLLWLVASSFDFLYLSAQLCGMVVLGNGFLFQDMPVLNLWMLLVVFNGIQLVTMDSMAERSRVRYMGLAN